MFILLLGWFWIIAGVLFLLKPEMMRNRLQKKSAKKLKKILFFITIFLSMMLISAAWKAHGILSKIVMIIGIIGIFKGFFLLKAKAADKILEWYVKQPVNFFRFGACLQILVGVLILALRK